MDIIWILQCESDKNTIINTSNEKIQEIQHNGKSKNFKSDLYLDSRRS
jgi:hypothetical protein